MDDCEIGAGSIITAGCIITTNIKIGKHSHLNLHTTIGHDCELGITLQLHLERTLAVNVKSEIVYILEQTVLSDKGLQFVMKQQSEWVEL